MTLRKPPVVSDEPSVTDSASPVVRPVADLVNRFPLVSELFVMLKAVVVVFELVIDVVLFNVSMLNKLLPAAFCKLNAVVESDWFRNMSGVIISPLKLRRPRP